MSIVSAFVSASLFGNAVGMQLRPSADQCAPLRNNFMDFSVNLCVGTPPQCFDVIADTGSNTVIVPSCLCQHDPSAGCTQGEKCFQGTNASSTFSIPDQPGLRQMSFGSGTIAGTLATDVVKVGPIQAEMSDGVFLMTNRAALRVESFEGILGMGVPSALQAQEKMFFTEANVDRFSLCVQSGEEGALRFGLPAFAQPIRQIGKFHWGLDFRGMSVGAKGSSGDQDILFCGSDSMTADMDSPCGLIPDSGTTLIIGPKAQVETLEESLCDAWPRCQQAGQENSAMSKSEAFHHLLEQCGEWLHDEHGVYEIPSLFFHVQGKSGNTHTFELTAWSWVAEEQVQGRKKCEFLVSHGADVGGSDYVTKKNGPVWIVGTPLFYEYVVGFDMSSMSVALEKGDCLSCASARTQLFAGDLRRTGTPRRSRGAHRSPRYNVTLPL